MLPVPYVRPEMGPLAAQQAEPVPAAAAPAKGKTPALPRPGWPPKADLEYLKIGIELLVLLLALPWLLRKILTRPGKATRDATKHLAE